MLSFDVNFVSEKASNNRISHNALFLNSIAYVVIKVMYGFYWLFLGIPYKSCIVGMLLACPYTPEFSSQLLYSSAESNRCQWNPAF